MTQRVILDLPEDIYGLLLTHLLPPLNRDKEQAAFVFAKSASIGGGVTFQFMDWQKINSKDLMYHSGDYLELTDQARAGVIKHAHDLGASIVEFHSHPMSRFAMFSWSDKRGFKEFVPHVWWRLKGKPYVAIVVSPTSFDALVWLTDPRTPQSLNVIKIGKLVFYPTGLTIRHWKDLYG